VYTKKLPFKDFNNQPRNTTLTFNLTEREVFKLMVEFKFIFDWRDRIDVEDLIDVDPADVVEFYNNFEEIVLSAYGVMSQDGLYFDKTGKFKFEESAMFAAYMVETLRDLTEINRFLEGVLPKGMEDLVKAADESLAVAAANSENPAELRAQLAALQAQIDQRSAEIGSGE